MINEVIFLLKHKDIFINHISGCYPLSEDFISTNSNKINWSFLSINEKLNWTEELIAKFDYWWDWGSLSGNEVIPWSEDIILRYADRWKVKVIKDTHEPCLLYNASIKCVGFPKVGPVKIRV